MRATARVLSALTQIPTAAAAKSAIARTPIMPRTVNIPTRATSALQIRHYTAKKEPGSAGSSESPSPITSRPSIPTDGEDVAASTAAADLATSPLVEPTTVAAELSPPSSERAPLAPTTETVEQAAEVVPKSKHDELQKAPPKPKALVRRRGVGKKNVYLPNFTFALVRTPHLPNNYAQFIVPLHINKLDVKSYLANLYDIKCLSIRSYVQQMPVKEKSRDMTRMEYRRPRAIKKMTIEMKESFVYPEAPTDLTPWDNELFHKVENHQSAVQKSLSPTASREAPAERRNRMAAEAEKLSKRRT